MERYARQQIQAVTRIDALTPEAIDEIFQHAEAASLSGDEARRESGTFPLEVIEAYQASYAETNRMLRAPWQSETMNCFVIRWSRCLRLA